MMFTTESLPLSTPVFRLLRDLIAEKTGHYFEESKMDLLQGKIAPLVLERGFDSFLDYYYLLKYDEKREEEWLKVMDAISVQETYFWREPDQIKALSTEIFPQLNHQNPKIRIWSAACASGEEPISIAIALNESGILKEERVEIVGTDFANTALEKARAGLYGERSFRNLPLDLKAKYFRPVGNKWKVDPELHSLIKWDRVNLMDEREIARYADSPVIFCRNVFIYFSKEAVKKVAENFYRMMPEGGFLFLGASESLLRISTSFSLEEIGGAFIYIKRRVG